jgi:glycosyltransferase involved in cell wall biosynthesis
MDVNDVPAASASACGDGLGAHPRVSVVVPAKNEARNLPHVFATIPRWVHETVLVDGGSTDGTVQVARELDPSIKIIAQRGRGKGDALRAGFDACEGEIIVMMDADGSTDGGEIIRFVSALLNGADYAKGSRFAVGGGSDDLTFSRRSGNWILATLVNRLFGTRYTDLCYGYNAFWAHHLPKFDLDCDGFEVETVLNVRVAELGLAVREVPSHEHSRLFGESNLHIVRDGLRIARFIVRERRAVGAARRLTDIAPVELTPTLVASNSAEPLQDFS